MIYEPPNYKELYEKQKDETDSWRNKAMFLRMTLRDQFAMNVITGLMAGVTNDTEWNEHEYSKTCYEVADAMIAARKGK